MDTSSLDWRGDAIAKKMLRATERAINRTMADCVSTAVPMAPIEYGTLRRSIRLETAREVSPGQVQGRWGSFQVRYAIFQELGTVRMAAHPFLRPSADINYPRLHGYLKQEMLA